jgi:hypothetical protein
VSILVTPLVVGNILNQATVAGEQTDPDMTDNTATQSTTVAPAPETGATIFIGRVTINGEMAPASTNVIVALPDGTVVGESTTGFDNLDTNQYRILVQATPALEGQLVTLRVPNRRVEPPATAVFAANSVIAVDINIIAGPEPTGKKRLFGLGLTAFILVIVIISAIILGIAGFLFIIIAKRRRPKPFVELRLVAGPVTEAMGFHFTPNSTVTLRFGETVLATATTDDDGAFTTVINAPSREPGDYPITVIDGGDVIVTVTLTVPDLTAQQDC